MSRSVLFLDFDGVLHPYGCTIDRYFCRVQSLEVWLRERPEIDVVVSSSWRENHPLDELRCFFDEDMQERIVGVTPILKRAFGDTMASDEPLPPYARELEVRQWLRECGEPWRHWAVLDDQAWLFKPFNHQLVLCRGDVGLTDAELEAVDAVLKRQR